MVTCSKIFLETALRSAVPAPTRDWTEAQHQRHADVYHASGWTVSLAWRSANKNQHPANSLCHAGHEAHHSMGIYNLWVKPNTPLHIWPFCDQATLISGKQRSTKQPLLYVVYAWYMVGVFALQLKQGQRNSEFSKPFSHLCPTCSFRHRLLSVLKYWASLQLVLQVNDCSSSVLQGCVRVWDAL